MFSLYIKPSDSLLHFVVFVSTFTFLNVFVGSLKLVLLFHFSRQNIQWLSDEIKSFWLPFFFDFIFNEVPVIVYVTVFDDLSIIYPFLIVSIGLFVSRMIMGKANLAIGVRESKAGSYDIDNKIVRLSINAFRAIVIIICSIVIMAVDFPIFPIKNVKTDHFGIALMVTYNLT